MKKFTKKFLKVATIVTASAGILFGGTMVGMNALIENSNKEKIAEVKREKERFEKENREIISEKKYTQFTYEREKVINNKSVDFSKFTVPIDLFTYNDGYINTLYSSTLSGYNNFQRNKHLYVYIGDNLTLNEKQLVRDATSYINTVVQGINPEYSLYLTDKLEDSHAYIHVINDSNYATKDYVLAVTELYESQSPLYNKPIMIRMQNENILKNDSYQYDVIYKGTFIHEFFHAAGLEHPRFHDDEDELLRPIMSSSSDVKDYLSIPELAGMYSWLNRDKYREAEQNGTLQEECNKDLMTYLSLIKYGLNQSLSYNKHSQTIYDIQDNQVFQLQYDETPDDGIDNKTTFTFNYPYNSFCEKISPKEDGSFEKVVRPFIFTHNSEGGGNIIILNEDCKHPENISVKYSKNIGTSLYKSDLSYDEVIKELKTIDPKNGYTVIFESAVREKHFEYETQNLWQSITGTTQKNDIMINEQLYKILYNYDWMVDGILAEETTNYINENMLSNNNLSYSDTNAESF